MSYVTIKVAKEEVQLETPQILTDKVQDVSEAKRVGKLEKNLEWPKSQVSKKYKDKEP